MGIRSEQQMVEAVRPQSLGIATRRPRRKHWTRYSYRTFYLFISPWLLGFVVLTVAPLVYAFLISFTNSDGLSPRWRWIGLNNYTELFRSQIAWHGLGQTLLYMAVTVPLMVGIGLGLALMLNHPIRGLGIFRVLLYLPAVVPVVASAIVWRNIFDREIGPLNALLAGLGVPAISWLQDPTVFISLATMVIWGVGSNMVISLAGLQNIPEELREAARLDGASFFQVLRTITIPLLSPVLFFQLVLGVINALQTLVQPLLFSQSFQSLTSGNVPSSNRLYMVEVYEEFFVKGRQGYGSAMLWVLFLIVLAFTLIIFRSSASWVYYEVEQKEQKGGW